MKKSKFTLPLKLLQEIARLDPKNKLLTAEQIKEMITNINKGMEHEKRNEIRLQQRGNGGNSEVNL